MPWAWLVGAAVSGCFGSVSEPTRHYYTLNLQPLRRVAAPHVEGLLRVRDLDAESAFDRFQMVLRRSPFELTYRQRDVWAVKPSRMLADLLARGIASGEVFTAVSRELGERRPDYLLAGEVRAIEVLEEQNQWFAHLALALSISHFDSGKIVWTFTADERRPVPNGDFAMAVRALSELASEAVERALVSMEHLRPPSAGGGAELTPLTRPVGAALPPPTRLDPAPPGADGEVTPPRQAEDGAAAPLPDPT